MINFNKSNIPLFLAIAVLSVLLFKQCNRDPEIKTVVEYQTKTDTITKTKILPGEIKYVQRVKTVKGNDSIIYVEKPSENDTTIVEAREYKTTLQADSARADISILSTGEVLDVKGTISWTEKKTTTFIREFNPNLYIYGETSTRPIFDKVELGLDYATEKMIYGINVEHIFPIQQTYFNVKVGIKIF